MKHTQGEWKANGFSVTKSDGFKIRQERPTGAGDWEAVDEKYIADAKLIAAAPDLLKAVDNITRWLRQAAEVLELKANEDGKNSFLKPKLNWYADKIEAAIKKATE